MTFSFSYFGKVWVGVTSLVCLTLVGVAFLYSSISHRREVSPELIENSSLQVTSTVRMGLAAINTGHFANRSSIKRPSRWEPPSR